MQDRKNQLEQQAMNKLLPAFITVLSLLIASCGGNDEQLQAFKNLELCNEQTLGVFLEKNAMSHEWQNMATEEYGDIVGFIADFEMYEDDSTSRYGFQATYQQSGLDETVWNFTPVAMEIMNQKRGKPGIIPSALAIQIFSNFCGSYKKLTVEEQTIMREEKLAAEQEKKRIEEENKRNQELENTKIQMAHTGNELVKALWYDANKKIGDGHISQDGSSKATMISSSTVNLTFLKTPLENQELIYNTMSKSTRSGQQTKLVCNKGSLEEKLWAWDCIQGL